MNCGGRVWKGDTITISVPFEVSGYTDLTISYYTDGETKVVKSESEVEIEDGFITYTFLPGELDTIADGVIRYQIDYSVDNVDYVTGTNTMSYLKTPKTYSAKTTEEYYEEGFSSGYTQGEEIGYASGHTDGYTEGEVVGKAEGYMSGYTQGEQVGYSQGYEEGHTQGKQDGEAVGYDIAVSDIRNQSISLSVSANGTYSANTEDSIYFNEVNVNVPQGSGSSCNLQAKSQSIDGSGTGLWNIYPDAGYDGMESVTILDEGYGEAKYVEGHAQGKYEGYESGHYDGMIEGFESGYTAGQADCPECDCSSAITEAYTQGYQSGYTQGQADCPECSGGTSCNLQSGNLSLPPEGVGSWTLYPEEGYDGFSYFQVSDNGYAESYWEQGYGLGFESGYTAGQADCSGGTSCDLTETWIDLMEGDDFEGQGVDYYVSAITPNYDGWYKVHIQDKDYGYSKFNEGYREFQNGLTSFSFGPEQIVASGNGSFTYTNASGWSSVTIGMPLVYSCRVIFANMSGFLNILSASDVTDIRFGYETLTQSEVIVGGNDITIYGTPTYGTGRFEDISFAIPTSIFSQISSWDASALSLNGFKSNLNAYIGGIVFTPYRTTTWQSGDKTFISVSTFNFDN